LPIPEALRYRTAFLRAIDDDLRGQGVT
jgi:hypothetical protein